MHSHLTAQQVSPEVVLLKANVRAGELRREAHHGDRTCPPGIMHGAPTHSVAFLLQAIHEQGYDVLPAETGCPCVGTADEEDCPHE